jgi:hypothetical protein
MVRSAFAAFAAAVMCMLVGCSGADPGPQGGGGGREDDGHLGWPPSDNDSTMDDGSYWPKWKNPCPGPACDPYRNDPRWLVDPPPDAVERPGETTMRPPSGIAPQSNGAIVR